VNALYPCIPNQEKTTAQGVVKPSGQAVQDALNVTKSVFKNLTPWQWFFLLAAGYLLITDKKRR
jgi:hypothetical protein